MQKERCERGIIGPEMTVGQLLDTYGPGQRFRDPGGKSSWVVGRDDDGIVIRKGHRGRCFTWIPSIRVFPVDDGWRSAWWRNRG